ncbi:MAG: TlpA family protein disulfide reductase [Muribaculaceae bacterium]|nr:TlpA family protein disulfide reductase [Muribaculaceae bacterium]
MKKFILPSMGLILGVMGAYADVTVNFPAGTSGEYEVESLLITDAAKPRRERPTPDLKKISAPSGSFANLPGGAAESVIFISEREGIPVYTEPGDNIVVNITGMEPLEYTISGTPLMEAVSSLTEQGNEIKKEYFAIARSGNPDETRMKQLVARYDLLFADYVKDHPDSPAAVYALLELDGQGYLDIFESLTPAAKNSTLYALAVEKKARVEKSIEAERRLEALQSGDVDAPAFTLKNLDGKNVSLADFKGKWVILDFWGSWCPWCIKGFPSLKEAYKEYSGKLEIIGIDCRDSEESWRNAVAKYELPWVQVYNPEPEATLLLDAYAVQGFPTKVIVNPEGKIANITVGEDPAFFNTLSNFINGK